MKLKNFWLRMMPVLVLVAATVAMSLGIYFQMIDNEVEICWKRLENATNSTAEKIQLRITDNLNFLTAVADNHILTHNIDDEKAVGRHLNSVMEQTLFDRIDVILPDNSVITQEGKNVERGGQSSFDSLAAKGTHITKRLVSSFTGKDVICCVTPIEDGRSIKGLLVGTLDCQTLSKAFEVFTYSGTSQLFVIDRADGNYLMDNWHDTLGNIHDIGTRQSIDGKSTVDFAPAILNGERARFAFVSKSNGGHSYQYCAPVENFNWEICVVVQEDVVFANVNNLDHQLLRVGIVELVLLIVFVLWNAFINFAILTREEKIKQFEYEKAKNDARSTFISNMSRDIKTPLNGIVGMLQIIKNHRNEPETVDDCLEKIEISAKYLSTLTSDVLDISEIENEKLVLSQDSVDLRQLADELDFMVGRQAYDAGVTYTLDHSRLEQPFILGSSVHIKRILLNLIGNAIKYSKNAGKRVWVTVADEPLDTEDKRLYRFVIKDNGIGMSEEFQKNMYKAFEQELIDARSEYQGYGLGLTIVSHLIKKMGGHIDLESAKGVGSTFTVSIPFTVDAKRNTPVDHAPDNTDIAGLRILLVEDNDFNMEIAEVLLSDAGATVDKAANGQLALDMFTASAPHTYDAIVMDVMMPVMDGCEATKAIRATDRPDAQTVPVIAMTASTFAEDIARCMDAGMNAHVPKPLDIGQLLATLANHRK